MDNEKFVMVGFGAGILPDLDRVLPAGSLVVVEDPDVVKARHAHERLAGFACVARLVESPIQDEAAAEDLVDEWALPRDVTAVIPGLEYGVVAAAALAHRLGLPGAGVAAARSLRDKVALRTAAARGGLAQPRWQEVRSVAEVRAFGLPEYVLKPANRQASIGVQRLGEDDDLDAAWQRMVTADEPLMRAPRAPAPRYLVEECMRGPEISVEALVHHGEVVFSNVTGKTVLPGRHPVELGHVVPVAPPPGTDAALRALVAATGFADGTLHSEWILVDGEPHLVECAGRLPGDEIVGLIDLVYGGSLVADLVTVLSGRNPRRPATATRGAAVCFLTAPPGLVGAVRALDAACAAEGVVSVRTTVEPGDRVGALVSSWDRVGRVVATGPTGDAAAANAARAAAAITVTTRDVVPSTVTDPRAAAAWWPHRPADPRDGLPWAAGAGDAVAFLGLPSGPALWLRRPGPAARRMEPIEVLSGATAGVEQDPSAAGAARAAHPVIMASAATGYGSPVVHSGHDGCGDLDMLVAALCGEARAANATPVVLHCPDGDPLLDALAAQGFAIGVTDLYPVLELPGAGVEDYLAALPKGRRGNVRREMAARSGGRADVFVGEQARPYLAVAARLSASAYRQRGEPSDDARALPIYTRLLDSCGDDFLLTLVHSGDRPVASACLVAGGTDLLLYSAGLELPGAQAVAGYFNAAYYLPIEFAYRRGLRRILLGPTSWQTKLLRGARFHPLYSAVPAGAPALVDLLAGTDARVRAALERLGG